MSIEIVEVSLRDGLQNEPRFFSLETKKILLANLLQSGLSRIEIGALVSPKRIPQMAQTLALLDSIDTVPAHCSLSVIIPNTQGWNSLIEQPTAYAKISEVAFLTAVSEQFCQKNIQCSIAESLARIRSVQEQMGTNTMRTRLYLSCIGGCPYAGEVSAKQVLAQVEKCLALNCNEIALSDTLGCGNIRELQTIFREVQRMRTDTSFAVHIHNTYGLALLHIYNALEAGITVIDASLGGLGGCPYALHASGNVATEDVCYALERMNYRLPYQSTDLAHLAQAQGQLLTLPIRSHLGMMRDSR